MEINKNIGSARGHDSCTLIILKYTDAILKNLQDHAYFFLNIINMSPPQSGGRHIGFPFSVRLSVCLSVCLSVAGLVRSSPPKPSVTFWWNLAGSISMKSSFASYQCCSGWMIFSGVMALWKIFLSALLHLHRVLHFDETWQEASVWSLVLHLTNAVPVEWFSVELWPFEIYSCPLFST